MARPADERQTTLRASAALLRKAKFYLDEDGSSLNESFVKFLEQYVQKRERRAGTHAPEPEEHRELAAV
jgi:hypothetical protein